MRVQQHWQPASARSSLTVCGRNLKAPAQVPTKRSSLTRIADNNGHVVRWSACADHERALSQIWMKPSMISGRAQHLADLSAECRPARMLGVARRQKKHEPRECLRPGVRVRLCKWAQRFEPYATVTRHFSAVERRAGGGGPGSRTEAEQGGTGRQVVVWAASQAKPDKRKHTASRLGSATTMATSVCAILSGY
jgi:hypothetical protein